MEKSYSLKLFEMPYLCQKLGFSSSSNDRVTGAVEFGYSDKVLVGNWQERRYQVPTCSDSDMIHSTYMEDYKGREGIPVRHSFWKNRIINEGSVDLKQGSANEYQDNMATVYDLAFRCKVPDFLSGNYGSTNSYGVKECKLDYWRSQKEDRPYHTEYSDSFSFYQCPTHITI